MQNQIAQWCTAAEYAGQVGITEFEVMKMTDKLVRGLQYRTTGGVLQINHEAVKAGYTEPVLCLPLTRLAALKNLVLCFDRRLGWLEIIATDTPHLYVMSCGEHIKIGISQNPLKRQRALQTSSAKDVCLELVYRTTKGVTARYIEGLLHQKLRRYRVAGEWFKQDALALVKQIPICHQTDKRKKIKS